MASLLFAFTILIFHSLPSQALQEKTTNLHFFLHDTISGPNPTAVMVARPNATGHSGDPTPFGTVFVIDDPMTEGPAADSPLVGSAQGLYVSSGLETISLVMGVDFMFTAGPYKDSSFIVFTRNPISHSEREVAVVGGRGVFRMARGFAKLHTYYLNVTTGDAIIEYNVTLLHF